MKFNIKISDEQRAKVNAKYEEFTKFAKETPGIKPNGSRDSKPEWLIQPLIIRARALSYKYFGR